MTSETAPGLRERKKAATRQALHEAAVRLAHEHGLEKLTVEAIADEAFVSRRTFSNYFASKEQALLHGDRVRIAALVDLFRARPAEETPTTAFVRAAEEFAAAHPVDPVQEERYREVLHHPTLGGAAAAVFAAGELELAEAIGRRLPAGSDRPLRARFLAAVFLAVVRVAAKSVERREQSLADLARQGLAIVSEGCS
ncbi:TetR/AcrR family transcriptional regulator [Streptomyces sp. NPDC101234]|uniref:TetR/AcrR family transcriptional regulator n=1 Tax=Streptomyces sp. NPDC101234 TaxID=3366138 RepID=UPI00381A726C